MVTSKIGQKVDKTTTASGTVSPPKGADVKGAPEQSVQQSERWEQLVADFSGLIFDQKGALKAPYASKPELSKAREATTERWEQLVADFSSRIFGQKGDLMLSKARENTTEGKLMKDLLASIEGLQESPDVESDPENEGVKKCKARAKEYLKKRT